MMSGDSTMFVLVAGLVLFAGMVQGLSGFGFGIVAMALLPLIVDIRVAAPFVTLLAALACLGTLRGHWRRVDWTEVRLLVLVVTVGLPVGLWGLDNLPRPVVMRVLGISLIAGALQDVIVRREFVLPRWTGGVLGMISGVLSGALNMGGPPLLLYLRGRSIPGHQLVSTLHVLFTYSAVVRSGLAASFGLVTGQVLVLLAVAAIPAWVGMVLGGRIRSGLSPRVLNRMLQGLMFLLGVYYVVAG